MLRTGEIRPEACLFKGGIRGESVGKQGGIRGESRGKRGESILELSFFPKPFFFSGGKQFRTEPFFKIPKRGFGRGDPQTAAAEGRAGNAVGKGCVGGGGLEVGN